MDEASFQQSDDQNDLIEIRPSSSIFSSNFWHGIPSRIVPFEELVSYGQELSGMLGDLGLYIPIVVSFATTKGPDGNYQIDLGATLIFTGLCNILTGLAFKVPIPVQPMKSIATVALGKFTTAQIMASGFLVGLVTFLLGVMNLMGLVGVLLDNAVIRGLQIGIGLDLFSKALLYLPGGKKPSFDYNQWASWDGFLVAVLATCFAALTLRSKRVPTAFLLFLFAVVVAAARMTSAGIPFSGEMTRLRVVNITAADWAVAATTGIAGQIPTTAINSCVAVVKLSKDLFPGRRTGVTERRVAMSVGLLNMVMVWFGGYPMCHGSGGLAGQHRFGARTNLSILVLGACKLLLGLFVGNGLAQLLRFFPQSILAVMLCISALELCFAGRSGLQGDPASVRLCFLTVCFTLFWGQHFGVVLGLLAALVAHLAACAMGP
eukprot:CAMPEP_0113715336 /NCGR_PEP_ID=MMETSP0038_2-20120614/33206_1 /TAXON_ID=2898 /ORGANISM="Cryptomonas paramecium" /LENGTH=432 /DNA_ID=CAMNT_0000642593 /DNA_START=85 /DNA_END=1380 /DNA_ORIENTATION=+ /assembly_acc=CAM_ASM_000170